MELKDIVTGKLEDITVADEYKALFETSGLTIVVKPNETIFSLIFIRDSYCYEK